jgi:hypothetical protein
MARKRYKPEEIVAKLRQVSMPFQISPNVPNDRSAWNPPASSCTSLTRSGAA